MWGGSIMRMWRIRGRSTCRTRRARLRRHRPRRRRRCQWRQRLRRRQGQRRRRRPCQRRRRRRPWQRRWRHPQRQSLRRCRRMARRQRRRAAPPRLVWRGCRARRGCGVRRRQCQGRGPTAYLVTWSCGRTEPLTRSCFAAARTARAGQQSCRRGELRRRSCSGAAAGHAAAAPYSDAWAGIGDGQHILHRSCAAVLSVMQTYRAPEQGRAASGLCTGGAGTTGFDFDQLARTTHCMVSMCLQSSTPRLRRDPCTRMYDHVSPSFVLFCITEKTPCNLTHRCQGFFLRVR